MIKVDLDAVISSFVTLLKEVDDGKEFVVNLNDKPIVINPIWEEIKKNEEEEYLKERLLGELCSMYYTSNNDYYVWLNNGFAEPIQTLGLDLIHNFSIYNSALENNKDTASKARRVLYSFFNLSLYNTFLGKATTPKKRGRPKKKSDKSS